MWSGGWGPLCTVASGEEGLTSPTYPGGSQQGRAVLTWPGPPVLFFVLSEDWGPAHQDKEDVVESWILFIAVSGVMSMALLNSWCRCASRFSPPYYVRSICES